MRRRSFITELLAALTVPAVPEFIPIKAASIDKATASRATFNPRDYIGDFKWISMPPGQQGGKKFGGMMS